MNKDKIGIKAVYPTNPTYSGMCIFYLDNIDEEDEFEAFTEVDTNNIEDLLNWLKSLPNNLLEHKALAFVNMDTFVMLTNSEALADEPYAIIPLTANQIKSLKVTLT